MNNRQNDSLLRVTTANKLNLKVVLYSLRGVDIERLLKKKESNFDPPPSTPTNKSNNKNASGFYVIK